jgi:hypothetical protein
MQCSERCATWGRLRCSRSHAPNAHPRPKTQNLRGSSRKPEAIPSVKPASVLHGFVAYWEVVTRDLVGLVLVLALVGLPLSASAQAPEEGSSLLERWQPEAFVDPAKPAPSSQAPSEEPALKLEVQSTGLEVTPTETTVEDVERRVRKARTGLIVSSLGLGVGGALIIAGSVLYVGNADEINFGPNIAMGTFGTIFSVGGIIGLGISGKTLRAAKRQLKLHSAGFEIVTASPVWKTDVYTLAELELRRRRAGFGLLATTAVAVIGVVPLVIGTQGKCEDEHGFVHNDSCRRLRTAGLVLTISGAVGMIVGGIVFGVRKGAERRGPQEAHWGTPRRVQWDLARSRLVF